VTGSNKGIGYEIVRLLGSTGGWIVVLCSRDTGRGEAARERLVKAGVKNVHCAQLDITEKKSVRDFTALMQRKFGAVDVLINNAAIAFKAKDPTPFQKQARPTIAVNTIATIAFTEKMIALLEKSVSGARIVNVASQSGSSAYSKMSVHRRRQLTAPGLSQKSILDLAEIFVSDVERGNHGAAGWPSTCYGTSKAFMISWTRILSRDYAAKGITAASCCPGWCATDMSNHMGPRTAAKGAETPVWLALEKTPLCGGFWYDKHEIGMKVFKAPVEGVLT